MSKNIHYQVVLSIIMTIRTHRSKRRDLTLEQSRDLLNGNGVPGHRLAGAARLKLAALLKEWQAARSAPPTAYELKVGAPVPPLLKMKLPAGSPNILEVQECLRVTLAPTGQGAGLSVTYNPRRPCTGWDVAWDIFIQLLQNGRLERIGGPCEKCGRYYLRKTAKPSIYCSRPCATQATALRRTREVRRARHERKLERAAAAIQKWGTLAEKRRMTTRWKDFVVDECTGDEASGEITVRFLSRAVNSGELVAPKTRLR